MVDPDDPATWRGSWRDTLIETLGIEVLEAGPDRVVATMPVTPAHHQPFGLLHGGASVALAETVASLGGVAALAGTDRTAVGLEINANHLRPVRSGTVRAEARPLHLGRSTQVWHIDIVDERGRSVCVSRCTLAVVSRGAAGVGSRRPPEPL